MRALYGRLNSDTRKTEATSQGHWFLRTSAESWEGKIVTTLERDEKTKEVCFTVERCDKSQSPGHGEVLASGKL